ncbi:unnamed protein product [Schistosoma turkestanicum]|nr:unnamed protein product [Schistosoma turkestanicum]
MDSSNVSNQQIWPLPDVDSDEEAFWDDKDLIAEYERLESLVKDKLTGELSQNAKSKSSGINGKFHPKLKQASSSTCNYSKVHHHTETIQKENDDDDSSVNRQSFHDNNNPICDLQWIPPCLNPPSQLFSRMASSRDSHSFSKDQPCITPKPTIFTNNLSTLEPILHTWYEAGYRLGRAHAMKLKSKSSVSSTSCK